MSLLETVANNNKYKWLKSAISNELPNPDVILRTIGNRISKLTELRVDTHLSSIIQSRKSGVLSLEWELLHNDDSQVQNTFIQDIFNNLDMNKIISEMLETPLYGYKFLEIVWEYRNGYYIPINVIGKPCEWFTFDNNNVGYFNRNDGVKIFASNMKFLILQNNASYDNPYGEALLSKCFWPIVFKKDVVKYWQVYIEKYGIPFMVGEMDDISDDNDALNNFMADLDELRRDGIIVIKKGQTVNQFDVTKANSAAMFEAAIHFHNSELSKAILSQTLTTEQGKTGSYAMSQTHLQVRSDVVDADKKIIESAFNELIKKIYYINFNQSKDIPKFRMFQQEDVDKALAERDAILKTLGVEFNKDYITTNYGIKEEHFEIVKATQPMFSDEGHNHGLDDKDTGMDDYAKATNKMLNYAISLIENMEDIDEAKQRIVDAYPNLDSSEMEQFLETAEIAARLGGTLDAD